MDFHFSPCSRNCPLYRVLLILMEIYGIIKTAPLSTIPSFISFSIPPPQNDGSVYLTTTILPVSEDSMLAKTAFMALRTDSPEIGGCFSCCGFQRVICCISEGWNHWNSRDGWYFTIQILIDNWICCDLFLLGISKNKLIAGSLPCIITNWIHLSKPRTLVP